MHMCKDGRCAGNLNWRMTTCPDRDSNGLHHACLLPVQWYVPWAGLTSPKPSQLHITHWHENLFLTQSVQAGKRFTAELSRMFHAYAEGNALEPIALKVAIATPALLLQKLSPSSKAHDHATCLQRQMQAWQGHINKLIIEGRTV